MDPFYLLTRLPVPFLARCHVPWDLRPLRSVAEEVPARESGLPQSAIERVWEACEALYRTGTHPALQICVRHRGNVVLHRALGHLSGNGPEDGPEVEKVLATTGTPFCIFSASKAITAMVIHKLASKGVLDLEDRVTHYIPEFGSHDKHRITLRHILAHRAGIPNLPPQSMELDLLGHPDRIVELLCEARPTSRPGRLLAYHAVTGGFVLGEVVRRVTGSDIRSVLQKEILDPLGFRWTNYGVRSEDLPRVAVNAFTGPAVPPPLSGLLRRALGVGVREVVELSNDPRFLTGIIPAGNVVTTAEELSAFFQCLLDDGEWAGTQVFEPRTVLHATSEQSYWELDFTLGVPLRYGLGFMLGDRVSLYGVDTPEAFGHLGFSNIFGWADPERDLAVAILNSGKPVLSAHVVRMVQLLLEIGRVFPRHVAA